MHSWKSWLGCWLLHSKVVVELGEVGGEQCTISANASLDGAADREGESNKEKEQRDGKVKYHPTS